MIFRTLMQCLLVLAAASLLAACGSGGSSSSDGSTGPALQQGQVVDPYIAGAVFQEVTQDGKVLQSESTPSDARGIFSFSHPLSEGSILEMKADASGRHNGVPYQGALRRLVEAGEEGVLVVSPLTTLLANGASPEVVLSFLADAGMPGMTEEDLKADPMAGLETLLPAQVSDSQLRNLQAAMAVNTFLHLLNDYRAGAMELVDPVNRQIMTDLVQAAKEALNSEGFQRMAVALEDDPGLAGHPLILGDSIRLAAHCMQTVADLADAGIPSSATIQSTVAETMESAMETAGAYLQERIGGPLPAPVPEPDPEGAALYTVNCAVCHGPLSSSTKSGRSVAQIEAAITSIPAMSFFSGLEPDEVQAIAGALNPAGPTTDPVEPPTADPAPPGDGETLYGANCAGCHGPLSSSTKFGRSETQIEAAINGVGSMSFLSSLEPDEILAIADALNPAEPEAPADPPAAETASPADGATLYGANCAGCHGPLSSSAKAGRSVTQIEAAIAANFGGMGFLSSLEPDEVQAISEALATAEPGPSTAYGDCTACHGQPPNGSEFPNTAGAHAAHLALPGVGSDCSICHTGAAHNGWVDLGFPGAYDARSGSATDNGDGTCSNISCHGGQSTPDWWTGSINVESQCSSCHTAGTSQYNGYSSGMHRKHVGDERLACTVCHDTGKLAAQHFDDLATASLEGPASATIGGGASRVTGYDPATRSCTNSCHGSERW